MGPCQVSLEKFHGTLWPARGLSEDRNILPTGNFRWILFLWF